MAKQYNERLLDVVSADEEALMARLKKVRAAVDHPAEKGSAVEDYVRDFLEPIIPDQYRITSGHIAFHANDCQTETVLDDNNKECVYRYSYDLGKDIIDLSPQLDILIYDALRFAPLASTPDFEVLPAEAVLASVEVKSIITGKKDKNGTTDLERMLTQSQKVRNIRIGQYHVPIPNSHIHTMLVMLPAREVVQIRTFVIALDYGGSITSARGLCEKLECLNSTIGGFFSGLYVGGLGYLRSHHSDRENDPLNGSFEIVAESNALAKFQNSLYSSLCRFPRQRADWTPAIDRYFELADALVPELVLRHDKETLSNHLNINAAQLEHVVAP